mgnify:CR=1 FL=1
MSIRHGGHPLRRPLFFTLRRKGCASAKTTSGAPGTTGSGLRGSALGLGRQNSDGKPCSGVSGGQKASTSMKTNSKKLALAGVLCAVAVVGSMLQFPVFGSQCAPVQHMVNVICAVFLGPGYGVAVAFLASLLRNIFGLGSLLAFPGSMCGALLCGLVYWKTRNLPATLAGEVFGTGIIGGLLSYPVAVAFMGVVAGSIAFYAYVVPFLVSTVGGSILAGILVFTLQKSGALKSMRAALEH